MAWHQGFNSGKCFICYCQEGLRWAWTEVGLSKEPYVTRGAISLHPRHVFMAWCLVKHRDNFNITFLPLITKESSTRFLPIGIHIDDIRMFSNSGLGRMMKEKVVVYFKILSYHLPGITEDKYGLDGLLLTETGIGYLSPNISTLASAELICFT